MKLPFVSRKRLNAEIIRANWSTKACDMLHTDLSTLTTDFLELRDKFEVLAAEHDNLNKAHSELEDKLHATQRTRDKGWKAYYKNKKRQEG